MFETECRGCYHAKQLGYFLYCSLHKDSYGNLQPAKERCDSFRSEAVQKKPSSIEDWGGENG